MRTRFQALAARIFLAASLNAAVLAKCAPSILQGAGVTVALSVLIVLAGVALGLALACLRAFGRRVAS